MSPCYPYKTRLHSQTNIKSTFTDETYSSHHSLAVCIWVSKYWLPSCVHLSQQPFFIYMDKNWRYYWIVVLLDAVTFVYPLHVAEMSSHRNSFEYIKSSGASNAGGGKITQLFPVGFL